MNHFEILKKYNVSAKKSLGQNFLVNDTILEQIANLLPIEGENVIEIGPGYGALTEKLLAHNPNILTLIELDPKMISILESRLSDGDLRVSEGTWFSIIHQDVLKYVPEFTTIPEKLPPAPLIEGGDERMRVGGVKRTQTHQSYSVIANIPYYITSPILFRFLYELAHKPSDMLILMQKEVGDKIRKAKGYKNSYLSLAMEYTCKSIVEVLPVSKGNFIPPPKIESSVLHFKRRPDFNEQKASRFLSIVSAGFVAPRKKLISNLSGKLNIPKETLLPIFERLGWSETIRAEEVDLEGWIEFIESLSKIL